MSEIDYAKVHNCLWQLLVNGKPRLEFATRDAVIKAVAQARGHHVTHLPRPLENPDEWLEALDDYHATLTHYCDECDDECEPDGRWGDLWLFYCHSCGTQYEVKND